MMVCLSRNGRDGDGLSTLPLQVEIELDWTTKKTPELDSLPVLSGWLADTKRDLPRLQLSAPPPFGVTSYIPP